MTLHTHREFEADLQRLSDAVREMGGQLEEILGGAQQALDQRNAEAARRMIDFDRRINRSELSADSLCMEILALRQPVASDLRFVATVMKMVTDLERIGDLAKNVCERVVELEDRPARIGHLTIVEMLANVQVTVRAAMEAFTARDAEAAEALIQRDDVIDEAYHRMLRELLDRMREDPEVIYEATRLQSIAKYVERIGDHATNVAEMIVFMVRGKDIRHRSAALPDLSS
jgi:phosphate transport system protein